jgi:hypothetical protein
MNDSGEARTRDEILHYLAGAVAYWGAYHNHKETSAWAAVAFMGVLGGFAPKMAEAVGPASLASKSLAAGAIAAFTVLASLYLREQLRLRRRAAALVHACFYLQALYISKPDVAILAAVFAPADDVRPETQSHSSVPHEVESVCRGFATKGTGPLRTLEGLAQVFIWLIGLILVALLWCSHGRA